MALLAAVSERGPVKSVNEDACAVLAAESSRGELLMAIVCDGVGGLSCGELASATVVSEFARWFEHQLPALLDDARSAELPLVLDAVQEAWAHLLCELNARIRGYGKARGISLATTFTGLLSCEGQFLVGHVGDCRAYLVSADDMVQLTADQTLLAQRLAEGTVSADEACDIPDNVILQAVGAEDELQPVFGRGAYTAGDLFVVCSDGAYKSVGNSVVREAFQPCVRQGADIGEVADRLVRRALARGERDNLTVTCVAPSVSVGSVSPALLGRVSDTASEGFGSSLPVPKVACSEGDQLMTEAEASFVMASHQVDAWPVAGMPTAATGDAR